MNGWDELQFELSAVRGVIQIAVKEGYSPTVSLSDNPKNHWCDLATWQQQRQAKAIWTETVTLRVGRRFESEPARAAIRPARDELLAAVNIGVLAKLDSYGMFPNEGKISTDLNDVRKLAIVWRCLPEVVMHAPDEFNDRWKLSVYCRFAVVPENVALQLITNVEAEEAIR